MGLVRGVLLLLLLLRPAKTIKLLFVLLSLPPFSLQFPFPRRRTIRRRVRMRYRPFCCSLFLTVKKPLTGKMADEDVCFPPPAYERPIARMRRYRSRPFFCRQARVPRHKAGAGPRGVITFLVLRRYDTESALSWERAAGKALLPEKGTARKQKRQDKMSTKLKGLVRYQMGRLERDQDIDILILS